MGKPGSLGPDGVLDHLADDRLARSKDLLDSRSSAPCRTPRPQCRSGHPPGTTRRSSGFRCRRRPLPCPAGRFAPCPGRYCRRSRWRRLGRETQCSISWRPSKTAIWVAWGADLDAHHVATEGLAAPVGGTATTGQGSQLLAVDRTEVGVDRLDLSWLPGRIAAAATPPAGLAIRCNRNGDRRTLGGRAAISDAGAGRSGSRRCCLFSDPGGLLLGPSDRPGLR